MRRPTAGDRVWRGWARRIVAAQTLALVGMIGLAGCRGPLFGGPPPRPALLVLIVVDQLRPDRLSPGQPDGLGRLQREGRVFSAASLDYAFTDTCPGHATASTGRFPLHHGIPANRFVPEGSLAPVYCVADPGPAGQLLRPPSAEGEGAEGSGGLGAGGDDPSSGRSPSSLRSDGLADWLKAASPRSRLYAVSGKDRAAIALAGRGGDGAWWLDRDGTGGMTTSRYWRDALPAWAAAWNRERVLSGVPAEWVHAARDPRGLVRPDDYRAEDPRFSRVSPHPLHRPEDPSGSIGRLAASPFLDRVLLDFALDLVDAEALGRRDRDATDVLALGLSATDFVGHLYGPFSQESRDALADLDEALGGFLAALEARVGRGRLAVVLTADHGVLPLPEWVQEVDLPENDCPVAGGRVSERAIAARLEAALEARLGSSAPSSAPAPSAPASSPTGRSGPGPGPARSIVAGAAATGPWIVLEGPRLRVNRARLAAAGRTPEALEAIVRETLAAEAGLAAVRSRHEVLDGAAEVVDADELRLRRLLQHSWAPGRGPDLVLVPQRGCLVTNRVFGTSHGSPHDYDRRVPLVFFGPGVEPGIDPRPARLVDLAPTVAAWLGLEVPDDLDGAALPLR